MIFPKNKDDRMAVSVLAPWKIRFLKQAFGLIVSFSLLVTGQLSRIVFLIHFFKNEILAL